MNAHHCNCCSDIIVLSLTVLALQIYIICRLNPFSFLLLNISGCHILQLPSFPFIHEFLYHVFCRARVRMEGEDVFGSKISLHFPQLLYPSVNCTDNLPVFSKSMLGSPYMHHLGPFPPPPNPALVAPPRLLDFHSRCGDGLADKEARFSADHVSRNKVVCMRNFNTFSDSLVYTTVCCFGYLLFYYICEIYRNRNCII